MDTWIRVSREFRESDDERRLGVDMKVGAALVATAVGAALAPGVMATGLTLGAGALGAAAEYVSSSLGGTTAQDIIDSYQRQVEKLKQSYDQELDQLRILVQSTARSKRNARSS